MQDPKGSVFIDLPKDLVAQRVTNPVDISHLEIPKIINDDDSDDDKGHPSRIGDTSITDKSSGKETEYYPTPPTVNAPSRSLHSGRFRRKIIVPTTPS